MNIEKSAFVAILKIAAKKMGNDLLFRGVNSILGMIFKDSFKIALGNFAFVIPMADFITYLTKVSYHSINEFYKEKSSGTVYNIQTNQTTGILIAKNTNGKSLKNFPILLPQNVEISISQITISSNDYTQGLSIRKIESSEVYKSLIGLYSEGERPVCTECCRTVTILGGAQIGHAVFCSKNPYRFMEFCDDCLTDLTKHSHNPGCRRFQLQSLRTT